MREWKGMLLYIYSTDKIDCFGGMFPREGSQDSFHNSILRRSLITSAKVFPFSHLGYHQPWDLWILLWVLHAKWLIASSTERAHPVRTVSWITTGIHNHPGNPHKFIMALRQHDASWVYRGVSILFGDNAQKCTAASITHNNDPPQVVLLCNHLPKQNGTVILFEVPTSIKKNELPTTLGKWEVMFAR